MEFLKLCLNGAGVIASLSVIAQGLVYGGLTPEGFGIWSLVFLFSVNEMMKVEN